MSDSDLYREMFDWDDDSHEYFVGGYEARNGEHYNVVAGDSPLDDPRDIGLGYVQVLIDDEIWRTFHGPFETWDDVEYAIADWFENGSG